MRKSKQQNVFEKYFVGRKLNFLVPTRNEMNEPEVINYEKVSV
jgi:hypothetical protein